MAGKWEFPGGKVERGETPQSALVRECLEELGSRIEVGSELARQRLDTGATLILFAARLSSNTAEPVALEHRKVGWFGSDQLPNLDWLATNRHRYIRDERRWQRGSGADRRTAGRRPALMVPGR